MINIFSLTVRTALIYAVLMLSMRISGKRQVGELQLSELVTAFLISEVASAPLSDRALPIIYAILPIAVLVCLEITVSYISTKSVTVKKLFEPSPTVLISNGRLSLGELKKQRLTADELISALRLQNIPNIANVKYCFLEHNGQISAFKDDDCLTVPVIVDGKIHGGHLKLLEKDEKWLTDQLNKQHITLSNVFIGLSDGKTFTVFAERQ